MDFSSETMQARRYLDNILKVYKKIYQPSIFYQQKYSSKIKANKDNVS